MRRVIKPTNLRSFFHRCTRHGWAWAAAASLALAAACGGKAGADGSGGGTGGDLPPENCSPGQTWEGDACSCTCDEDGAWACLSDEVPDPMAWSVFAPVVKLYVVVDDSRGMLGAQARLADAMGTFAERMDASGLDYMVAVTGTGAHTPDGACDGGGTGVGLGVASCRERLSAFKDAPNAPADPASVCTDRCSLDTLATNDGAAYLASRSGVLNVDADASAAEVLRCMMPVGNYGCPFVQPLEAAVAAFGAGAYAPDAAPSAEGARALLVVTDGTECSVEDGSIFDPAGNRVFWSDPAAADPTEAVCWNAGVECQGGGGGVYDTCEPADRTADGGPAANQADAVLAPVGMLVARLGEVFSSVTGPPLRVLAIAGVPTGFPQEPVVYADATDPAVQDTYGIGPGCEAADVLAPPPVRLGAVFEELAQSYASDPAAESLASICADDYEAPVQRLADDLTEHALAATCRDLGPSLAGATEAEIQKLCSAAHLRVDLQGGVTETPLPYCDGGAANPQIPAGEDACVYVVTGADVPAACAGDPDQRMVSIRTLRRPSYAYTWRDRVAFRCATQDVEDACST